MKKKNLSKQEAIFVKKLVECGKPGDAYRAAFSCSGLTEIQISGRAATVKARKHVKAALSSAKKHVEQDLKFGIQDIVEIWHDIATADPNELMSNLRRCCRHCYGRGHHYQWKDEGEFAYALGLAIKTRGKDRMPIPSDEGGYGFNFTFRPHPECTECKGEGHLDTFFADTRTLSKKGRRLFAGIKQTQNGMQVMTRDQDAALANLAKFYGMFVEKVQHSGPNGGPLLSANMELPTDPVEAANVYAQLIKNKARG